MGHLCDWFREHICFSLISSGACVQVGMYVPKTRKLAAFEKILTILS